MVAWALLTSMLLGCDDTLSFRDLVSGHTVPAGGPGSQAEGQGLSRSGPGQNDNVGSHCMAWVCVSSRVCLLALLGSPWKGVTVVLDSPTGYIAALGTNICTSFKQNLHENRRKIAFVTQIVHKNPLFGGHSGDCKVVPGGSTGCEESLRR